VPPGILAGEGGAGGPDSPAPYTGWEGGVGGGQGFFVRVPGPPPKKSFSPSPASFLVRKTHPTLKARKNPHVHREEAFLVQEHRVQFDLVQFRVFAGKNSQGFHGGKKRLGVPEGVAPIAGEQGVALDFFHQVF
jgi:hypothetical protein